MKKVNLFAAEKSFAGNVAEFMVKTLWRSEYKLELQEAIERELASIHGLENCRGSYIPDDQIDAAIAEKVSMIESYKDAYEEIVSEWTRFKGAPAVRDAYKAYKAGNAPDGFVEMFKVLGGLEVSVDTDIVLDLCDAVAGDSARTNVKQVVQTGKWAVTRRSESEFVKIVYRRLADWMLLKGTLRVVGATVRGGGEDVAELLIEIPSLTAAKYAKKKKSAK